MRAFGIEVFLWRAGDVNPLIDRVDTAKIRGLTPSRSPTYKKTGAAENSAAPVSLSHPMPAIAGLALWQRWRESDVREHGVRCNSQVVASV